MFISANYYENIFATYKFNRKVYRLGYVLYIKYFFNIRLYIVIINIRLQYTKTIFDCDR